MDSGILSGILIVASRVSLCGFIIYECIVFGIKEGAGLDGDVFAMMCLMLKQRKKKDIAKKETIL
jgi:hypothetical protein